MGTKTISRRKFIAGSLTGSAAFPLMLLPSYGHGAEIKPPSERITLGCIGNGGQGTFLLKSFLEKTDAQIVAVCDVHRDRRNRAKNLVEEKYTERFGKSNYSGCDAYNDFREIIGRKDIDAVVIAVPDNWHAIPAVMAAEAGKDIYGEKPMAKTIREGRAIVEAVKKNGRIFQTGSHRRSVERFRFGCEVVRNGLIGKLHTIRTSVPTGMEIDPQPEMPIPDGFDYDTWLGPAPWKPFTEKRWTPLPSLILDYGNGMITDLGTHFSDIAQWGHGTEYTGPVSIDGKGEFPKRGLYDTMIHCHIEYEFADGVKMICIDKFPKPLISARFEGTEGWIDIGYNETTMYPESMRTKVFGPNDIRLYRSLDHHQNFLDCVKSRKETVAPAEVGHRSFSLCALGNISMLLDRKLHWNPEKEEFIGDSEANAMLSRAMRAPWKLP